MWDVKRTLIALISVLAFLLALGCGVRPGADEGAACGQPSARRAAAETEEPSETLSSLHVEGTALVNEDGEPVQLRGISTHGLAWFPEYVNEDCFRQLHEQWGVDVIRLAMYTAEYGGYCNGGDQQALKQLILSGVDYATKLGMYVIVDWHILTDLDPNVHADEAIEFFREMSATLADHNNVLYEICNEPNGGTSWAAVKQYAQQVIPVIRENAPGAVIIVGTPNWCQFVDQAAADPITDYDNIMYSLHFYADTHRADLRGAMENAVAAGLPIFVTEYGICDASGNGAINTEEANKWVEAMDRLGISYVNWSLCNKDESASLLRAECQKTSGFATEDLSESGRWVYEMLTGEHLPPAPASAAVSEQEPETAQSAVQTSGEIQITASLANSWQSEGKSFYQYVLTLTNTSDTAVSGWTAELEFTGDIALQDGWNGDYAVDGSTMRITAKEYNRDIPAGGSVTDVGFIVSGGAVAQ